MTDNNEISINCLLLGKTKSGKSSIGNSLLGSYEFKSKFSPYSLTKECQLCRTYIPQFARRMGKELCLRLQVLDTPGSSHSSLEHEEVKHRIKKALSQQFPGGLHMALLVLRADIPFCEEDNQYTVKLAEELLGPTWNDFTTVIFTHGDKLSETCMKEDEYLMSAPKKLLTLLEKVHKKYIFRDPSDKSLQKERAILTNQMFDYVKNNKYQSLHFD